MENYDIFISGALQLSGLVLLYYDHALTLSTEFRYLWKRPFFLGSILFFCNRYLAFFGHFPIAYYNFIQVSFHNPRCSALNKYDQALLVATQVFVGFILAIRVYALWNRSKWVLWLIIVMAFGFGGVAAWSIASAPATDVAAGEDQCPQPGLAAHTAIRHAVAWECMFAFDGIIFALTMVRSYRATRESGRASVPLVEVMLRDGAVYFLVMIVANAANVATFYTLGPRLRGNLSTMASSISVTMTSRLILNLHQNTEHLMSTSIYTDSSNGIRRPLTRRRRVGTNEDESPEPLDTLRTADYLHSIRVTSQDGREILRDQQRTNILEFPSV